MREIFFRGKRKDNSKWIESSTLFRIGKDVYMLQPVNAEITYDSNYNITAIIGRKAIMVEVIPETVGQYTGEKDKNGKRIFERDIIRNIDDSDIGVVKWYSEHGAFMIRRISDNQIFWAFDNDFSKVEIVGNIYDNLELIESDDAAIDNEVITALLS